MDLRIIFEKMRDQFWLWPLVIIASLLLLLSLVLQIPNASADDSLWSFLFAGSSPEGARLILGSIATAIMTVVGVLFSLTIVVLQQASNQFSPRVIETFIRSYISQIVLGFYVGTFIYCLLLLRQVHESPNGESQLPQAAISMSIVLVAACMGLLIYYVNYLSHSVKSTSIITTIEKETIAYLKSYLLELQKLRVPGSVGTSNHKNECDLIMGSPGYFQSLNFFRLKKKLHSVSWEMKVRFAPGDYVDLERPLAVLATDRPLSSEELASVKETFDMGASRTHAQDPMYGVRQLVDIALRALSPGINDPTTALEAVNRVGTILRYFTLHCELPTEIQITEVGRIHLAEFRYDSLLELSFAEILHFAKEHPRVQNRIQEILESLIEDSKNLQRRQHCQHLLTRMLQGPL